MSRSSSVARKTSRSGWPLVVAVRLYRSTVGRLPRRASCLFATTCSRHVEDVARTHGLRAGARECRARLAACRPGYAFEFDDHDWRILGADGSIHRSVELSEIVHREAAQLAAVLTAELPVP